ncbi:putative calcium-binding protein cml10 [Fagus crenata]
MSHFRSKYPSANRVSTETKRASIAGSEEQMKYVFGSSDTNKDGYLSKEELKKAFGEIGVEYPTLRAMKALWHADANGDNYISKKELPELVKYTSTLAKK